MSALLSNDELEVFRWENDKPDLSQAILQRLQFLFVPTSQRVVGQNQLCQSWEATIDAPFSWQRRCEIALDAEMLQIW